MYESFIKHIGKVFILELDRNMNYILVHIKSSPDSRISPGLNWKIIEGINCRFLFGRKIIPFSLRIYRIEHVVVTMKIKKSNKIFMEQGGNIPTFVHFNSHQKSKYDGKAR